MSFHQQTLELLEQRLQGMRNEDFAAWAAIPLEDMGIIELDRVVGRASDFGREIRNELCVSDGSRLKEKWREVASRLWVHSPAAVNPTNLFAALCCLASSQIYVEGSVRASGPQ